MTAKRLLGLALAGTIIGVGLWGPGYDEEAHARYDAQQEAVEAREEARRAGPVTVYRPDGTRTVKNASFTDTLTRIGATAVNMGLATDYRLSWGGDLELTISSLLPGDARAVADAICGNPYGIEPGHRLKVFILTSSDRPAAVCNL